MIILRVEHREKKNHDGLGLGPYAGYALDTFGGLPGLRGDRILVAPAEWPIDQRVTDGWNCGVRDLKQCKHWFYAYKEKLKEKGFVIRVYDVPPAKICVMQHQVVFEAKNAKLVQELDLDVMAEC